MKIAGRKFHEQAMDEIAEKLKSIVAQYGPESFAVSTSGWNTQVTYGADRRFMNLLGSPNWTSGVSLALAIRLRLTS